ncbi:diguanylate cyclase domain-containing protein [Breoghania sp.]|uniref:GGDEF domain-containing protein n=1 Tax=Breoghania sp. TaxID=2065378 RepID=UPI0029CA3393|nr:diguanylate cyclase [Breoghania sp.]
MDTILLVEDSSFFEKAVSRSFRRSDGFELIVGRTCAEASDILDEHAAKISVALVDLSLPDTTDVETVDLTTHHKVPTIVFTSRFDPDLQTRLYGKGIVDYVLKDSPASLSYLRELVLRLRANRGIGALMLQHPDSPMKDVEEQLRRLQLSLVYASTAKEAINEITDNEYIRLLVVDSDIPDISTMELIKQVRLRRGPEAVAIFALSKTLKRTDMVRLLKSGANEVLAKDCAPEEFLLRTGQNLDTIDRILKLTDAANNDAMTGLYNRRFLFEAGTHVFAECRRSHQPIPVALIDIDRFKQVNDQYGHEVGDAVIKHLANDIASICDGNILTVRLGGDEFCLLMPGSTLEAARDRCGALVSRFHRHIHTADGNPLDVTLSIGLSSGYEDKLSEALRVADERMYAAKSLGRDRIISEDYEMVEDQVVEHVLLDV